MRKIHYLAIIPFILGICCFIAFNIIGSRVAPDGTLIEQFALIPIGYLFIAVGVILEILITSFLFIKSLLK